MRGVEDDGRHAEGGNSVDERADAAGSGDGAERESQWGQVEHAEVVPIRRGRGVVSDHG